MIEIITPHKWVHVVDAMCGGGGTLWGTGKALADRGYRMRAVAINHWSKAIATHQANHPDVVHFREGIDDVDIERIVDDELDGYVDLLCLSPECDGFSRARGGKVTTDAQRCHAHFLINTITKVPVRRCFVENVWEFTTWGPLCELPKGHDGKHGRQWPPAHPKTRCYKRLKGKDENGQEYEGSFFQGWLADITRAGWDFRFWPLNAADYGAPTDRTRFIGVGCRDQGGVFKPVPTHCDPRKLPKPDMFGQVTIKPWRKAKEIIRKDRLGASLLTSKSRRKDGAVRSPKTLVRLGRGANEIWGPLGSVIATSLIERGLPADSKPALEAARIVGLLPKDEYGLPILDVSVSSTDGIVLSQHGGGVADGDDSPVPTITHGGAHTITRATVGSAIINPYYKTGVASPDDDPLPTITAKDRFELSRMTLEPMLSVQRGNNVPRSASSPVQTITGIPTCMLILQPKLGAVAVTDDVVITENFGEREGQLPRYYTDQKPAAAVTQRGAGDIVRAAVSLASGTTISLSRLIRGTDGRLYSVDVFSRMFDLDELLEATGCPADYIVIGTKAEQKEQVGNMVCPPVAYACVAAQFDADAKLVILPTTPRIPTPLPAGREPASVRSQRARKEEVA